MCVSGTGYAADAVGLGGGRAGGPGGHRPGHGRATPSLRASRALLAGSAQIQSHARASDPFGTPKPYFLRITAVCSPPNLFSVFVFDTGQLPHALRSSAFTNSYQSTKRPLRVGAARFGLGLVCFGCALAWVGFPLRVLWVRAGSLVVRMGLQLVSFWVAWVCFVLAWARYSFALGLLSPWLRVFGAGAGQLPIGFG